MNPLSAQFAAFAVTALVVYLVLRAVGARRAGRELARARRHALWCAVIGFFASSSSDWFDAFTHVAAERATGDWFWTGMGMAATPAAWLLFVYVAGQFTWPRDLKPLRSASLQPRSLGTLVSGPLVTAFALVLFGAAAALWAVRDVTGMAPQPERIVEREDYWAQYAARDGLRPFEQVLPVSLAAFGCIVLAVLIVTLLVLRRKPLPGITDHDNRLLRCTWLNRLLRTAIHLVAVTAGSLLHYKARWLSGQADHYADTTSDFDPLVLEQLQASVNQWDSVANYTVIGIALLMLFWRPPTGYQALAPVPANAVGRMRDQLFSMQFITAAGVLVLLALLWPMTSSSQSSTAMPTAADAERVMLLLVAAFWAYLLLNAAVMAYTSLVSRSAAGFPRHHRRLPTWLYVTTGVLVLAGLVVLLFPPLDLLWGMVPARPAMSLGVAAAAMAGFVGFGWLARHMVMPWAVEPGIEIWYRRVLQLRALRALAALMVAMPLAGYPFPAGCVVFALVIFLLPAGLVLERPDPARAPVEAGRSR